MNGCSVVDVCVCSGRTGRLGQWWSTRRCRAQRPCALRTWLPACCRPVGMYTKYAQVLGRASLSFARECALVVCWWVCVVQSSHHRASRRHPFAPLCNPTSVRTCFLSVSDVVQYKDPPTLSLMYFGRGRFALLAVVGDADTHALSELATCRRSPEEELAIPGRATEISREDSFK